MIWYERSRPVLSFSVAPKVRVVPVATIMLRDKTQQSTHIYGVGVDGVELQALFLGEMVWVRAQWH